jgi:hypothetical protein
MGYASKYNQASQYFRFLSFQKDNKLLNHWEKHLEVKKHMSYYVELIR